MNALNDKDPIITEPSQDQPSRPCSHKEREHLLALYDKSCMTQKAFAREHGIKYSTFVGWLQTRRNLQRCEQTTNANSPLNLFQEVSVPATPSSPEEASLEIVLAEGSLLRGQDPKALSQLFAHIKALC